MVRAAYPCRLLSAPTCSCNCASGLAECAVQVSERLIAACCLHLSTHDAVCGTQAVQTPARLMSALLLQATRNFVQLCAEGYYDGTPFFRMVKGAYVQAR